MYPDLLYQIALTLTPNIGYVHAKALVSHFGTAEAIFKAKKHELENIEGIGTVRANSIKTFQISDNCEAEVAFIEKYNITPLFINDPAYPQRLLNCYDSPTLLFYKGNANLNALKIVSIVGTRNNSDYGKQICEDIIADLSQEDVLIISGLAFGIDTIAHKAALKNNLSTIGVMAHGLDRIYPSQNKALAKDMTEQGGLITEFQSETIPDKQNFPMRNRIVAGMCDALVVIESGKKGGSLITGEIGNSYNKDVFAVPGKTTDIRSEGCNYLIKNNKASLITSADDILEQMNWKPLDKRSVKKQRTLFIDFTPDEKIVVDLLQEKDALHIDELFLRSGLSSGAIAGALLMLEMQGLIASQPGKMYKIL